MKASQKQLINNFKKLDGENKSFAVSIQKVYTDTDGQIVAKNTIPSWVDKKVPFYLFGGFDKDGSYKIGQVVCPPLTGFYFQFVLDAQSFFLKYTGLNEVEDLIRSGDIIIVYANHPETPTNFCWVIISAANRAISSITENLNGQHFNRQFVYESDNANQYFEVLQVVRMDDLGTYSADAIEPHVYKNPYTTLDDLILVDLEFSLNQFLGIYSYILYDSDLINFVFKTIKKK